MFTDNRGVLHSLKNLPFLPKEILVSENSKNVLRGLHMSPYAKFIYLVRGRIHDFYCLDGQVTETVMNAGDSLLIPANSAHGFFSLENSELVYLLEAEFDPTKDRNVYWKTPEFNIPNFDQAILSTKDHNSKYYGTYEYLVLGASGFLGSQCVKYLRAAGKTVLESSVRLENPNEIRDQIYKSGAKYVICAAGISGRPTIDWCETHEEETYKTNYLDVLNLMEICKNVHLTIFGSGAVYSGAKPRYTEDDPPDLDTKVYSKYRMQLERNLKPNVLYLRIMYPCTFDGHPKCFYQKMLGRKGNIHDASVSITSVPHLFPLLPNLVNHTGIFNFVLKGSISLRRLVGETAPVDAHGEMRGNYELVVDKLATYINVPTIDSINENDCMRHRTDTHG
jgi:dTDP-4-dehydrorhamnose 3,5-epimerase-like enzyme